jgi:hypothetical protein
LQEKPQSGDALLQQALDRQARGLPESGEPLTIDRHWCEPPEQQTLQVVYRTRGDSTGPVHEAVVDGRTVSLDDPQRLLPVVVPKPWGREIWYTGMEARGESRIGTSEADSLPLGTYLALAPGHLTAGHTPVLLKILDPRPEPVLGELYLEVHEQKQEVYVVTAVDECAWPDGQGRIRYGINQARRRSCADDDAFRKEFLSALNAYEAVRRQIDAGDTGLDDAEMAARTTALAFTDERPLTVGDVISVPTWVPHSLQQGVRVVEFQTPTYERFIVASSQKVLTQDGWDSAHAVANMRLDTPEDPPPERIADNVERIVRFDEFSVWQVQLNENDPISLPEGLPYVLAFCITGQVELTGPGSRLTLDAGAAALIPRASAGRPMRTDTECLLLLAAPGL